MKYLFLSTENIISGYSKQLTSLNVHVHDREGFTYIMSCPFLNFQLGPVCDRMDPCPDGICKDTCGGKGYECTYETGLGIFLRLYCCAYRFRAFLGNI